MVISWQFQFLYNWLRLGTNEAKLVIGLSENTGNDAESCHLHRKHNPFVIAAAAGTLNLPLAAPPPSSVRISRNRQLTQANHHLPPRLKWKTEQPSLPPCLLPFSVPATHVVLFAQFSRRHSQFLSLEPSDTRTHSLAIVLPLSVYLSFLRPRERFPLFSSGRGVAVAVVFAS